MFQKERCLKWISFLFLQHVQFCLRRVTQSCLIQCCNRGSQVQSALRVHNVHFIWGSDADTSLCIVMCIFLHASYSYSYYREEGGVGVKPKDHTHSGWKTIWRQVRKCHLFRLFISVTGYRHSCGYSDGGGVRMPNLVDKLLEWI